MAQGKNTAINLTYPKVASLQYHIFKKSNNLLLTKDIFGNIIITDFGAGCNSPPAVKAVAQARDPRSARLIW